MSFKDLFSHTHTHTHTHTHRGCVPGWGWRFIVCLPAIHSKVGEGRVLGTEVEYKAVKSLQSGCLVHGGEPLDVRKKEFVFQHFAQVLKFLGICNTQIYVILNVTNCRLGVSE